MLQTPLLPIQAVHDIFTPSCVHTPGSHWPLVALTRTQDSQQQMMTKRSFVLQVILSGNWFKVGDTGLIPLRWLDKWPWGTACSNTMWTAVSTSPLSNYPPLNNPSLSPSLPPTLSLSFVSPAPSSSLCLDLTRNLWKFPIWTLLILWVTPTTKPW